MVISVGLFNFKKHVFLLSLIFPVLWLVALLRTYAPGRDYIYTMHGALIFITLVVFSLFFWLIKKRGELKRGAIVFFVWLFFLLSFYSVSTIFYLHSLPYNSIVGLFNNLIWQVTVFLFAMSWVSTERNFNIHLSAYKMSVFFSFFSLFSGLVAVQLLFTKQAFFGPIAFTVDELRWPQLYGWFSSPNYLVDAVSIGVIAAFFLISLSKINKIYSILFLLSLLLMLVATGSRGGILGCFVALLWQFALVLVMQPGLRKKLRYLRWYLLVAFLTATVGSASLLGYIYLTGHNIEWFIIDVLRLRAENLSTGTGRIYIWQDALEVFANSNIFQLLFGHGNNFYVESHGASLHNTYLQILIDHGLVTLISFIIFSFWFFWVSICLAKKVRYSSDLLCSVAFLSAPFAYVVVRAIFQGPVFLSGNISWAFTIVAGVIICTAYCSRSFLNERN